MFRNFGPREEISLYRDWILRLLDKLSSPVRLVFDGLDRLDAEAASLRLLQVLLDHLPLHLQLLILSREMPPLGVQELQIHQAAFILTADELAFTLRETRQFFKKT